jgi:hypothetical protein
LRPGTLVSHVDRTPVNTPAEFHSVVAEKEGDVRLRLVGSLGNPNSEVVVHVEP